MSDGNETRTSQVAMLKQKHSEGKQLTVLDMNSTSWCNAPMFQHQGGKRELMQPGRLRAPICGCVLILLFAKACRKQHQTDIVQILTEDPVEHAEVLWYSMPAAHQALHHDQQRRHLLSKIKQSPRSLSSHCLCVCTGLLPFQAERIEFLTSASKPPPFCV